MCIIDVDNNNDAQYSSEEKQDKIEVRIYYKYLFIYLIYLAIKNIILNNLYLLQIIEYINEVEDNIVQWTEWTLAKLTLELPQLRRSYFYRASQNEWSLKKIRNNRIFLYLLTY